LAAYHGHDQELAQFFTTAEQELLLEGYAEARREGWQKVADNGSITYYSIYSCILII